jgi:chromosome segregation ATPase
MTPENQALLEAIRTMIYEGNAPMAARLDRLETRMERLEQHVETIDARLERLERHVETIDARLERLEQHVEIIDARTSQLSSDFLDLRDRIPLLEERIDNGFRALKSDLNFAFSDIRKSSAAQERSDRTIDMLKRELAGLQQRMAAIEGAQGAS